MPSSDELGENLIFILSQPRSGSTLLQRILAAHPLIHSASEPWIMLAPLYGLRHRDTRASYNAPLAQAARDDFMRTLPDGEADYLEGVRRMFGYLYARALETSGKRYFLDKTPPYYFILPELFRTFPRAKYLFLFRNPLAVLAAIISSWIYQDWLSLYNFKDAIRNAPRWLLEGTQMQAIEKQVVHYESLVTEPEATLERVCNRLGSAYGTEMIQYGSQPTPPWRMGDHRTTLHARPHRDSIDKWRGALAEAQTWRALHDYLALLGADVVAAMGYSYSQLAQTLEETRPSALALWSTSSLEWLLAKPMNERRLYAQLRFRMLASLRQRGLGSTVALAARRGMESRTSPRPTAQI